MKQSFTSLETDPIVERLEQRGDTKPLTSLPIKSVAGIISYTG